MAAALRLAAIGGHTTELLELHSAQPRLRIVFVPGNPGIVSFYKEYVAHLFRFTGGNASITAVSHIAHTAKDFEKGKLFTLQQQIDHKAAFLEEQFQNNDLPVVLVGHSIGAYIIMELLKRYPNKIDYVVGLYPFLKTNPDSFKQKVIKTACGSSIIRSVLGSVAYTMGKWPEWLSRNLMKALFGRAWGASSVETAWRYLIRGSMMNNFVYMGMTEFGKLHEELDWEFLRQNEKKICLLFGIDDHWGPLSLHKQICKEVPGLRTFVGREDIMHDFCCTDYGSEWVARFTTDAFVEQVCK